MAEELVREGQTPCLCGKGTVRWEAWEHDTWGSRRRFIARLECDACKSNVCIDMGFYWDLDGSQAASELASTSYSLRQQAMAAAVERYALPWAEFLSSRGSQYHIRKVLGRLRPKRRLRNQQTDLSASGLRAIAEATLRDDPLGVLREMGSDDQEIIGHLRAADELHGKAKARREAARVAQVERPEWAQ